MTPLIAVDDVRNAHVPLNNLFSILHLSELLLGRRWHFMFPTSNGP